jgi:hypothetical protein
MSHFDSPAASLRFYLVAATGTPEAKIADRARTNRSAQILWEIPPANEPAEKLPDQPIINAPKDEFETLVVEMPSARNATGKKSISMVENQD